MPTELETTWSEVREALRADVPDFQFHIWLEPLELAGRSGETLHVRAPDHIRTWVRDRYLPILTRAATRAIDPRATVEIVDDGWQAPQPTASDRDELDREVARLMPKYTFEQFVIGDGNRFAHAAALAVAEMPGQAYNPLFIHGRPGLGKTHLLHAIGNYVTRFGDGLRVRYSTVEEFTTEFVRSVRGGGDVDAFKQAFRGVDVLLLDDVQFLVQKVRTEEELFHTFNYLQDSGRQVVMTCDRSPTELDGLQERLAQRFASGLVIPIEAPDRSVRRAILEKRSHLDAISVDPDLLDEIAGLVTTSVRALEAALIQVVAYASLRGEPPTPALARHLLGRLGGQRPEREPCTVGAIVQATATEFGVAADSLLARDRRPTVARARKVAMFLARELTQESLPEIGRDFGGRDHTTVLHAVRSVTEALPADHGLAAAVESVKSQLEPTA